VGLPLHFEVVKAGHELDERGRRCKRCTVIVWLLLHMPRTLEYLSNEQKLINAKRQNTNCFCVNGAFVITQYFGGILVGQPTNNTIPTIISYHRISHNHDWLKILSEHANHGTVLVLLAELLLTAGCESVSPFHD
jgi:hypothetical protein